MATSSSSGEDEHEPLTPEDKKRAFVHQSLWGKTLIVAAGPIFNFILAYLIYTALYRTFGFCAGAQLQGHHSGNQPSFLASAGRSGPD